MLMCPLVWLAYGELARPIGRNMDLCCLVDVSASETSIFDD
jgi:hypothetical protein